MQSEIFDLFAFGIAIHDERGTLVYANGPAQGRLADPLVCRVTRAARLRKGAGALGANDDVQVCAVVRGNRVVTIISGDQACVAAASRFYELTPTEVRISALLAEGNTSRQIATILGVTLHTVQSHLKSLFAKTHTESQNALIARLRGALAFLAVEDFFLASPSIEGCTNSSERLTSAAPVQGNNRGESP